MFSVRATALVYAGRLGQAEELLDRAYDQVVDQPAAVARAYVTHRLAIWHLEQGRLTSAFRRAGESFTLFQQLGYTFQARWPYIAAVQALAQDGRADQAAQTLATLDALALPVMLLNETDLAQAWAWAAAAAGDLPGARHHLEGAADLGEEVGDLVGAASALHGLARLGRASQVAARLAALADEIDGALVAARALYARALADRSSPDLDEVSRDLEDLGAFLYSAEASAEAAVVLQRAGNPRDARAAEHRAAQLLTHCEEPLHLRCGRSAPGRTSHPASSKPPCRPQPASLTNKSPRTCTSQCELSRATSSAPTRSSGSPDVINWPMPCSTNRSRTVGLLTSSAASGNLCA